ncbi:MAG: Crp/Fnr family transcriptional regulator [Dehalococcoidia bacterium]|jgi:CRP/FNR family transcriptional regulator
MSITIENLSSLRYFKEVGEDRLAGLAQLFGQRSFQKGQTIISEGDSEPNLYFVGAGVVKIFKTSAEGKEQIIKIGRPGESFNDAAVFGGGTSPYSVQALGMSTLIYLVHKNDLMPFMEKNWRVVKNALEALAAQSRLLLDLIEDLSFKNVMGRVAKILMENSLHGAEGFQKLTQYEMAAMAGTAREVVGRSLKSLEDTGAVRLERHKIVIVNKELLNQLAGLT